MKYQEVLESICRDVQSLAGLGKQADYIPALAKVNPDQFGICIHSIHGDVYSEGDADVPFSIQSISKVFSLAIALNLLGDDLWERVGKEPSGTSFNSLIQLEAEHGKPRNPFINAGAIVVADILLEKLPSPKENFIEFIRELSGNPHIDYNEEVARSEREKGYLNAAIANLLKITIILMEK